MPASRMLHKFEVSIYMDEAVYLKKTPSSTLEELINAALGDELILAVEKASSDLRKLLPPELWEAIKIVVRP